MVSKLLIALYVILTSLGLIVLKLGSSGQMPFIVNNGKVLFNLNPYFLSGILLYGISFVIYLFLIAKYDLGYIIPLATALVYVLIFIASYFIFKESFTLMKIVAIAMIIGGVIILNIKQ